MNYEQAQILGLQALTYMAENEEILLTYLNLSGIAPDELKNSAGNPAILGSILDYFLQNEKKLINFCEVTEIAPKQLQKARQLLPGGESVPYST